VLTLPFTSPSQCCGCNATVDEHQAEDENGIVENLKDVVDEFKQVRTSGLALAH